MVDTLHLRNPIKSFDDAYYDAITLINRPLTEKDYYEACHHPKDHKRSNDALYAGLPYVVRHMKRNWKAGNKRKAVLQAALVPFVTLGMIASAAMFHAPGITASLIVDNYVPMKRRSEAATREDALARAIFRVSQVVTCFAGSRQYHDAAGKRPVTNRELREICTVANGLTCAVGQFQLRSPDSRIRHSKPLEKSARYLDKRTDQISVRIYKY